MKTLVVIDDDVVRLRFVALLEARGHEVTTRANAEGALEAYAREAHSLVLLDRVLAGTDGLELCRRLQALSRTHASVILVVTSGDAPEDLQAVLDAGADDYIIAPIDPALLSVRLAVAEQGVRHRLERLAVEARLADTLALLQKNQGGDVHDLNHQLDARIQFHELVGRSAAMRQLYQQIRDVAAVDSTVLIEGETGTGKELVARAIHFNSRRRDKPFIAVNCAGLTESLVAGQLFGHKRGAFTGAIQDHVGLFEATTGGTVFLDEIGDVPLSIQTSLLRVLQEREITRIGEARPRRIDVRVVVATHRDLNQEVARGNFRADLLYRIRVARIQLPPLRERLEDVSLLTTSLLAQARTTTGKSVTGVSEEALQRLLEYDWPGNVRELKSALEFAVIRARSPVVQLGDLPQELRSPAPSHPVPPGLEDPDLDDRERLLLALKRARRNRTVAARLLGISRATFYRYLERYQIRLED